MLQKQLSKGVAVCLVAAVLFAFFLTQTEAAILRKTASQDDWKKATASGFRKGLIVFGKGPKTSFSADDASYQSDFPGFVQGKVIVGSREDQWRRMSPLLLCGLDKMKFRANGSPVNSFALNQNPLVPLSSVPADCGYNMQKNPFGLILNVPYHGCHVVNEDSFYSLPLDWHGISVTLKCPKSQQGYTTAAPQDPVTYPWPSYPWPTLKPQVPATASPQDPAHPQVPPELLQLLQVLWSQLEHTPDLPPLPQDPALWTAYVSYLLQLIQTQGQSTTTTPPQDQTQWNAYFSHLLQLQNQGQSSTPLQQDPMQWNIYFSNVLQNQGHSTPPPPQDPTQWNAYVSYLLQLQNQGQSSTTPPPQDPTQWNAYFSHLLQLQNQGQSTTPATPQDQTQWNAYFSYLLQLLQNQDQSTTPSPPQDPTLWNSYCYRLLQLLLSQAQSTPASQDPQMPHNLPPHHIYHLLGLQHTHMEPTTTPAPNVPQNPMQSPVGSFQMHPWVYSVPTAAPTTPPPPSSSWDDLQQGQVPVWYQQRQVPLWYQMQPTTSATTKLQG